MRDFAACFSENALQISDSSCSGSSHNPSIQNTVTCLYQSTLSNQQHRLITVTWCKNTRGQVLSVKMDDPCCLCKVDTSSWLFWKKKGNKTFESGTSKIEVRWDLSSAKYGSGPEPISDYFVAVVSDSELALLLGDMAEEAVKKIHTGPSANWVLVSRKEHVFGNSLYSTKARFTDHGRAHDIVIECRGKNGGDKGPKLSVRIDKKMVVHVKQLLWKFRGNQTIVVDGLPIDMMWDVHDWFFNPASGNAVFMFRTRSGLENHPLAASEKKEQETLGFSLLIYAWKNQR